MTKINPRNAREGFISNKGSIKKEKDIARGLLALLLTEHGPADEEIRLKNPPKSPFFGSKIWKMSRIFLIFEP